MATKRTDAFDVFASKNDRRDADISALKEMSSHSTLRGMGNPIAPINTPARGTVPPPVSIQDAEVLVTAETQITQNPLFADDLIELVEESGLLVLEPEQASDDDAIEVSSSFLVEDLDGFPAGIETAAVPDLSDHTEELEELTSDHLAYVETRGEIVEVERPRLPLTIPPTQDIPVLNRHALYNESAEYSDGVPRIASRARGLSSKTLRVPAPKSSKPGSWLRTAAIGAVFVAGISAGVGFAIHSSAPSTPKTAPVSAPAPVALAAASAAPERETPVQAEAALPVVAPLDAAAAEQALAGEVVEAQEPQVQPLEVDALEAAEPREEIATATEPAPPLANTPPAPTTGAVATGPVVTSLAPEPEPEPAKVKTKRSSRSKRAADPDKAPSKKAVIDSGVDTKLADPGVLMLGAKPPCQIRIDGKMTGLTTPQRVLKLAPGKHRVTLTNQEHQIRDSFKVSIVSGKKTRIVRDNTSKIK
jgi:hypothetical protein